VACPEAANNAASGASLVPLLTLGLPGGGATAVMLGALMMLDITPGPLLFQKHGAMVWALIASMYVGNALLLILNWPLVNVFARVMSVPAKYLMPIVLVISTIGVWSLSYSSVDLLLAAARHARLLPAEQVSHRPLILGLILGGEWRAYRGAHHFQEHPSFSEMISLTCWWARCSCSADAPASEQFQPARAAARRVSGCRHVMRRRRVRRGDARFDDGAVPRCRQTAEARTSRIEVATEADADESWGFTKGSAWSPPAHGQGTCSRC
jgi:hypothetical protein